MKFACRKHVDHAIDDYVDFHQVAPSLMHTWEWRKADGSPLDTTCDYCHERAIYILTVQPKTESYHHF